MAEIIIGLLNFISLMFLCINRFLKEENKKVLELADLKLSTFLKKVNQSDSKEILNKIRKLFGRISFISFLLLFFSIFIIDYLPTKFFAYIYIVFFFTFFLSLLIWVSLDWSSQNLFIESLKSWMVGCLTLSIIFNVFITLLFPSNPIAITCHLILSELQIIGLNVSESVSPAMAVLYTGLFCLVVIISMSFFMSVITYFVYFPIRLLVFSLLKLAKFLSLSKDKQLIQFICSLIVALSSSISIYMAISS